MQPQDIKEVPMRAHVQHDSDKRAAKRHPAQMLWQAGPPESEMRFTLRHLVLSEIRGLVARWHATLRLDFDQPSRSSVEVVADAASLETGATERDNHIRSAEFLKTWSFPEIRFRSTNVRAGDREGQFLIMGDLTIRGVTREVTVTAERLGAAGRPSANSSLVFMCHAIVDRQAFGLHWNQDLDCGGVVVSDEIDVHIRVEARRAARET
jgi:polyisoprenoid-binding protein YceI